MFRTLCLTGMLLALAAISAVAVPERPMLPNLFPFPHASGILKTFSATGDVYLTVAFFQSLGTNGRMCASCHLPDQGWTISAQAVAHRFRTSGGLDPIFGTNDGANCDHHIEVSTLE